MESRTRILVLLSICWKSAVQHRFAETTAKILKHAFAHFIDLLIYSVSLRVCYSSHYKMEKTTILVLKMKDLPPKEVRVDHI